MVGIPKFNQNISLTKKVDAKPVDEQGTKTQEKAQVAKPEVNAPELNQPTVRLSLSNLQQIAGVKPVKVNTDVKPLKRIVFLSFQEYLDKKCILKKGDLISINTEDPNHPGQTVNNFFRIGDGGSLIPITIEEFDAFDYE